ncbi:hypothetical protein F4778DRAFT_474802 [Xylariomycetidae sp. FL2044]|nr:hypothetical protein F4778DRAFT_474802 [Xylariomycetidae sp. FL2044]
MMEGSAPKRRKTSPTTNVPIAGDSNPSSTPIDGVNRRSTRHNRPSFLSPTKASLARSNPDILERRSASRPQRSQDAPTASEPDSPTSHGVVAELLSAQLEGASETSRAENVSEEGDLGARDPAPSQTSSVLRRVTGRMAAKPRRTPNRPSPRPLPAPSGEEEELIDPFRGRRRLRRSPPPGALPETEAEEPELPPTPTQKGLSDPSSINTSPRGIHSTPSKRPRKMKSSPLKQPPLRPSDFSKETTDPRALSPVAEKALRSEDTKKERRRKSHPARTVEEPDPLIDKKSLRDSLVTQLSHLEKDLRLLSRANDKLYRQHRETPRASLELDRSDADGLLDLLRRHTLPVEKEPSPDPIKEWLDAALNPISFLPFRDPATTVPLFDDPMEDREPEKPLPISHHPILMTAEEELPYLQVFTPLTFTSTVSIGPREDIADAEPLMQRHAISVSCSEPGIFGAKLEMMVNTQNWAITEFVVPRLDPHAIGELGPFVEKILQGGSNSALTRNVTVVTWAMSEWVRLATKRARFWCEVERDLGTADGRQTCAEEVRRATRKGRRRRTRVAAGEDADDDQETGDATRGLGRFESDKSSFTKAELLPHLGRTSLDLGLSPHDVAAIDREIPTIRIQWNISFDWTGEGQSKVGVALGAPPEWHGSDVKGSLAEIPVLFDKLVQETGNPMDAVKTVVALLVGERKR